MALQAESVFGLLKFCTQLSEEDARNRNPDPLKALTISLHNKICRKKDAQADYDAFLAEEADCSKENFAEAVKTHDDARGLYARCVTFVLRKLAEEVAQKGEDYLVSMTNLTSVEKTLQFYVPAAILPFLDPGVGAPLEKRSTLVKFWQHVEDPETCRKHLHEAMDCLFKLGNACKSFQFILNSKLLGDVIAGCEQLLHFDDRRLETQYETFIYDEVHRSHLIAQFLTLIGGFCITERRVPAPAWLQNFIGTRLSNVVSRENGLVFLFGAFDDLGGEHFWTNFATLSKVALLLTTCPKSQKPKDYYLNVTKQLLDLMKHQQWANHLQMLFALFIEEGSKRFRGILDVLFIDRILAPFERLMESTAGFEKTDLNGYWNQEFDTSLKLLHVWLSALPRITQVPFVNRLHRVFLTLAVMYDSSPKESLIKQHLELILRRIVRASGTPDLQAQSLLNQAILAPKETWLLCVEPKHKKMVEEEGEELEKPVYAYDIYLDIHTDDDILKTKIWAILAVLETFPKQEMRKLVMELLRRSVKRWRDIDGRESMKSRFVGADEDAETEKLTTQYIMRSIVEIYLSDEDENDGEDMLCIVDVCDVILSGVCGKLLEKFDRKKRLDFVKEEPEEAAVEMRSIELAIGILGGVIVTADSDPELMKTLSKMTTTMSRFTKIVDSNQVHAAQELVALSDSVKKLIEAIGGVAPPKDDLKPKDHQKPGTSTDELTACLHELDDPSEPIRGHSLIMLVRWMRQKTPGIVERMDPELLYQKILTQIDDPDSYVFLAAVGALAELAFWQTEPYLGKLVAFFAEERTGDEGLMLRCKLGEALCKVFAQLGDFAPIYFSQMVGVLLKMTATGDELVKASALGSLAELIVACRGRRFDSDINEIIFCIDRLLLIEKSSLVRRQAVNLLRSVLASCHYNIFEAIPDNLRDIRRSLSSLWKTDRDEVVRLHAELALIEIKEAISTHVKSLEATYTNRRIRI
ncbi:hypothetical protein L596_010167 [Steinernema carpocapsae]|uniref:RNA polymerase II assembly factor Rtp1 C-terminal domain-containing protein n=1 Tax=Steinernema carpocapsae TaxID=34508 RepID=A0A4U5PHJ0_STECR|nr:hypothetical protein L596_010167 [Steinernema carpocapsae]